MLSRGNFFKSVSASSSTTSAPPPAQAPQSSIPISKFRRDTVIYNAFSQAVKWGEIELIGAELGHFDELEQSLAAVLHSYHGITHFGRFLFLQLYPVVATTEGVLDLITNQQASPPLSPAASPTTPNYSSPIKPSAYMTTPNNTMVSRPRPDTVTTLSRLDSTSAQIPSNAQPPQLELLSPQNSFHNPTSPMRSPLKLISPKTRHKMSNPPGVSPLSYHTPYHQQITSNSNISETDSVTIDQPAVLTTALSGFLSFNTIDWLNNLYIRHQTTNWDFYRKQSSQYHQILKIHHELSELYAYCQEHHTMPLFHFTNNYPFKSHNILLSPMVYKQASIQRMIVEAVSTFYMYNVSLYTVQQRRHLITQQLIASYLPCGYFLLCLWTFVENIRSTIAQIQHSYLHVSARQQSINSSMLSIEPVPEQISGLNNTSQQELQLSIAPFFDQTNLRISTRPLSLSQDCMHHISLPKTRFQIQFEIEQQQQQEQDHDDAQHHAEDESQQHDAPIEYVVFSSQPPTSTTNTTTGRARSNMRPNSAEGQWTTFSSATPPRDTPANHQDAHQCRYIPAIDLRQLPAQLYYSTRDLTKSCHELNTIISSSLDEMYLLFMSNPALLQLLDQHASQFITLYRLVHPVCVVDDQGLTHLASTSATIPSTHPSFNQQPSQHQQQQPQPSQQLSAINNSSVSSSRHRSTAVSSHTINAPRTLLPPSFPSNAASATLSNSSSLLMSTSRSTRNNNELSMSYSASSQPTLSHVNSETVAARPTSTDPYEDGIGPSECSLYQEENILDRLDAIVDSIPMNARMYQQDFIVLAFLAASQHESIFDTIFRLQVVSETVSTTTNNNNNQQQHASTVTSTNASKKINLSDITLGMLLVPLEPILQVLHHLQVELFSALLPLHHYWTKMTQSFIQSVSFAKVYDNLELGESFVNALFQVDPFVNKGRYQTYSSLAQTLMLSKIEERIQRRAAYQQAQILAAQTNGQEESTNYASILASGPKFSYTDSGNNPHQAIIAPLPSTHLYPVVLTDEITHQKRGISPAFWGHIEVELRPYMLHSTCAFPVLDQPSLSVSPEDGQSLLTTGPQSNLKSNSSVPNSPILAANHTSSDPTPLISENQYELQSPTIMQMPIKHRNDVQLEFPSFSLPCGDSSQPILKQGVDQNGPMPAWLPQQNNTTNSINVGFLPLL